ncbi:MAG: hypothetical protein R3F37_07370 [Candidatus Competibacteraceae bacterium]
MWGQALAIALVIASGVATLVMSLSTVDSLRLTQERFYRDYRFADAFVSLKRAPESLARRIQDIPGVEQVETRVLGAVTMDIPDFPEPVSGQLVSLPDDGEARLNRLYLRQGRLLDPNHNDEVIISEALRKRITLSWAASCAQLLNSRGDSDHRRYRPVAEYIYRDSARAMFPDPKRYGILWVVARCSARPTIWKGASLATLTPAGAYVRGGSVGPARSAALTLTVA